MHVYMWINKNCVILMQQPTGFGFSTTNNKGVIKLAHENQFQVYRDNNNLNIADAHFNQLMINGTQIFDMSGNIHTQIQTKIFTHMYTRRREEGSERRDGRERAHAERKARRERENREKREKREERKERKERKYDKQRKERKESSVFRRS